MEENTYHQILKKSRRLACAGGICAGISLIIGGVLLNSVALVLSIVSYVKLKPLNNVPDITNGYVNKVKKSAVVAIAVSLIALVLNIVTIMLFMPQIIDIVNGASLDSSFGMSSGSNSYGYTPSKTWG